MKDYRQIKVWQKAHQLTLAVYRATAAYPDTERFGLISQTRRASASVPANIAEGCGREGDSEFARFLQIAMGSATELDYHLLLAHDLSFLRKDIYAKLAPAAAEVQRMLAAFVRKVRSTSG